MALNRYQASSDVKRFSSLWMSLEKKVLRTNNESSSRYAEITKCLRDLISEDYVHQRDLDSVICLLFSSHPYALRFSNPASVGFARSRPYDVWFLRRNYSELTFVIAEIEDAIPARYIKWKDESFRNDLGVIFNTRPEYTLEPNLSTESYTETSFLYKTIQYRDSDDWDYFLRMGGSDKNFRILFAKLQQDKRCIPKKFVIWYYEHFRNKKPIVQKTPKRR